MACEKQSAARQQVDSASCHTAASTPGSPDYEAARRRVLWMGFGPQCLVYKVNDGDTCPQRRDEVFQAGPFNLHAEGCFTAATLRPRAYPEIYVVRWVVDVSMRVQDGLKCLDVNGPNKRCRKRGLNGQGQR